jgi:glycosyltransferase involved in cell wall biosynthesis
LRFRLAIIGGFASKTEETELHELIGRRGLQNAVEILGFVSDEQKDRALRDADLFCFPTYYFAEGQPANLIEALAYGLPIVTTRWRAIPEMLPQAENYHGLVNPKSPEQIAGALIHLTTAELTGTMRGIFLQRYTLEQHLSAMAKAFHDVETPGHAALPRKT